MRGNFGFVPIAQRNEGELSSCVPHDGRLVGRGGDEGGAVVPVAVRHGHVVRDERGVRETALELGR